MSDLPAVRREGGPYAVGTVENGVDHGRILKPVARMRMDQDLARCGVVAPEELHDLVSLQWK